MSAIAQYQLERMLARRQFETDLGLTRNEMLVILVRRDRNDLQLGRHAEWESCF